jgi:hypothetical protein
MISPTSPRRSRGSLVLLAAGLARNIASGLRLALFLPVRVHDFRATPGDYATLVLFNFAAWLTASAARTGFTGEFDLDAALTYFAAVPLVLGAGFAVAALYGRREIALALAVAWVSADVLFEALGLGLLALSTGLGAYALLAFGLLAWIWAVALRAVAVCAGTHRPQFYQGAQVASAMTAFALLAFPDREAWIAPEAPQRPPALADERLFHLQGELIERRLAAIAPGQPGVAELYFVGFAPDGSQDVFAREMRSVKRLFDQRFRTRGRSIALVNGEDTLEEFPLATATNLRRSLARVARQMNAEEDALFLFVSAHGDEAHQLSAWQPPLEPAAMSPTSLARMLQDAGIKWRIVVVSACFSGGFVEPLRDENTMIVTASAADRHSFGCEAGQDYTYFGRAYFDDALAKTRSFIEAFALARETVAKQEAAEDLEPSIPQIWVGRALEPRLPALEARAPR